MLKTLSIILLLTLPLFAEEKDTSLAETERSLQLKDLQSQALYGFYSKNFPKSAQIISQIKAISPESIEYHYLTGVLFFVKKDYTHSIDSLRKSEAMNPDHELSLYLLGMNYSLQGNWKDALYYFERANSVTYNPYYQINLAIAWLQNNDITRAISSAERAIELKENFSNAKILLSHLYTLNKQEEKAWNICQEQKKIQTSNNSFAENCALLSFSFKKDYQNVISILNGRKNISLRSRRILARTYYKLNDFRKAYFDYRSFIYTSSFRKEEGLEYMEILVLSSADIELEKFKSLFFVKFPNTEDEVDILIRTAELKRDSMNMFYYQFKS